VIAVDRVAIQLLSERGLLSPTSLARATRHSDAKQITLDDALVELGVISATELAIARARARECPFLDLRRFDINHANAARLPRRIAEELTAFPLFVIDGVATVGMADPADPAAYDRLRRSMLMEVDAVLCETAPLRRLIANAYGGLEGRPDAAPRQPDEQHETRRSA
jgi:hypothetical protein